MKTQENTQSEEVNLQELLASDPKLREDLLHSPQAVLESIQGLQPGELDGLDIRPIPVTPKTILLAIPCKTDELDDNQLHEISAGLKIGKWRIGLNSAVGASVGGIAGAAAGAGTMGTIGGALGGAIIPGVGVVIGGALGAGYGGTLGGAAGAAVGGALGNALDNM